MGYVSLPEGNRAGNPESPDIHLAGLARFPRVQ